MLHPLLEIPVRGTWQLPGALKRDLQCHLARWNAKTDWRGFSDRPGQAYPGIPQQERYASGSWPASYLCWYLFAALIMTPNWSLVRQVPPVPSATSLKKHSIISIAGTAVGTFWLRHTHKLLIEKTVQKHPLSHGQFQLHRKHVCIAPVSVNYASVQKDSARICASSHC